MSMAHDLTKPVKQPAGKKAGIVDHRYGFPIPKDHRKSALLFNETLNVEKMETLYDALSTGATFRSAAMQAGMTPSEFEYMWKLGRGGHPTYSGFFEKAMRVRGKYAAKLQRHVSDHAMTQDGIEDGTALKVLKAEEKDSWIDDREKVAEVTVNLGIGKVVLNTDYGDEREHDVVDGEVEDAEVIE